MLYQENLHRYVCACVCVHGKRIYLKANVCLQSNLLQKNLRKKEKIERNILKMKLSTTKVKCWQHDNYSHKKKRKTKNQIFSLISTFSISVRQIQ